MCFLNIISKHELRRMVIIKIGELPMGNSHLRNIQKTLRKEQEGIINIKQFPYVTFFYK